MEPGELCAMTDLQMQTPEWLVQASVSGNFKSILNLIHVGIEMICSTFFAYYDILAYPRKAPQLCINLKGRLQIHVYP